MTSGRAFVVMDRLVDQPTGGPLCLRRPEIASVVVQALQDGQLRFQRYRRHAFVVMPHHVHLLVSPAVTTQQWLGPLKGFTAHQANRKRVQRYIEQNPVRVGLVALAEEFGWSSAAPGRSPAAG